MKIAVTYDQGNVFQHFGKSQYFKFYTVDMPSGTITAAEVVPTNGSGHGALAAFLKEHRSCNLQPMPVWFPYRHGALLSYVRKSIR